jgi:chromosomal replication initiation ATPase DnaA
MIKFFDINPKNAEKIEKILQSNEEHNDKNLDPSIIKFMLLNLKNNLKTLLDYVSEMMDTYAGHE